MFIIVDVNPYEINTITNITKIKFARGIKKLVFAKI